MNKPEIKEVEQLSPAQIKEIAIKKVLELTHGRRTKDRSGAAQYGNRRSRIDLGDVMASTGEAVEVKGRGKKTADGMLVGQFMFNGLLGSGNQHKNFDYLFRVGIELGSVDYEYKIFVFTYREVKNMCQGNPAKTFSCSATPFVEPYDGYDWKMPNRGNIWSNVFWMHHWSEEKIMTRFFVKDGRRPDWLGKLSELRRPVK